MSNSDQIDAIPSYKDLALEHRIMLRALVGIREHCEHSIEDATRGDGGTDVPPVALDQFQGVLDALDVIGRRINPGSKQRASQIVLAPSQ